MTQDERIDILSAMPPAKQSQLNTGLIIVSILVGIGGLGGILWQVHRYLSPIEAVLPAVEKVEYAVQHQAEEISSISRVQSIQTEALKTLAEVAKDSKEIRRDVDGHEHRLRTIEKELETLD